MKTNRRTFLRNFATAISAGAFLSNVSPKAAQQSSPSTEKIPCRITEFPEPDEAFPGRGPVRNAAWFRRIWISRRKFFWQNRLQDQNAVVFLGDSITQGWQNLADFFPGMKVANRGISGDVTRGVLYRMQDDVILLKPKAVVLLIGTNDLGSGGTPEDAAYNIEEILHRLHWERPDMPLILCLVMPRAPQYAKRVQKLNQLIQEAAIKFPTCRICDTWSIYVQPNGGVTRDEFPDLLHPNQKGYKKWAEALRPILIDLELLPK